LERSPIYHVQNANTPLLIMHGKEDTRVHPSQSMELYRYLRTHNQAPVRMVFYPDEGHGNRKAAARYDFSRRLMRWMDHYLKGLGGDPPSYDLDYDALKSNDG
jgi:dipeptidyl aminopeptidase/acylaminoacyl peptidase